MVMLQVVGVGRCCGGGGGAKLFGDLYGAKAESELTKT